MGVAYYPELKPRVPGLKPNLAVGGKPIARAWPLLGAWAQELGVRPLESFYSESLKESFAHIGEPVPPEMVGGPHDTPAEWSDPGEGLKAVRALIDRVKAERAAALTFKDDDGEGREVDSESLIGDLESLASVLVAGMKHGSKFRLRIDV